VGTLSDGRQQSKRHSKTSKATSPLRPIFHQQEDPIEAHIFIAFLAYCLQHALAPGLTPRSIFEKFAVVQVIEMTIPTTDSRPLTLTRYTKSEPEFKMLLEKPKLVLSQQSPPKITATQLPSAYLTSMISDTWHLQNPRIGPKSG